MHSILASFLGLALLVMPGGGWLGVYLDASDGTAKISEVVPDSPAQKAGLRSGDVIVAVGEEKTATTEDLIKTIGGKDPGERVKLKVKRGDGHTMVVVKLGKRPSETAVAESAPPVARRGGRPGVAAVESRPSKVSKANKASKASKASQRSKPRGPSTMQEPSKPDVAKPTAAPERPSVFLGVRVVEEDGRLLIDGVLDDSPAAKAGFREGDTFAAIGRRRLRSLRDLDAAIKTLRVGRPVPVALMNGDERRSVVLKPAAARGADAPAKEHEHAEAHDHGEGHAAREHGEHGKEHGEREGHGRSEKHEHEAELEREIEAMRQEIRNVRKELEQLRRQLRREGGGRGRKD